MMLVPEPRRSEHYDLLGELASGGMATVYLGRQRRDDDGSEQLVAVKSMRQELAEDEAFLAMFLDEATLTSKIKHPNVVPTLDVVSAGGRLLIVMEYVEGISLAKLLELAWRRKTTVPSAVAIAILCDVLRGLHAAHELADDDGRPLSVVHRDVSPQNVLVGIDGVARILDFGIAKAATQQHVTARGEIKGKLAYMPPEQQLAETVDRRSDVYAAGVVLWEMLAARRLFSAGTEDELVRQVFEGRVDPPSLLSEEALPPELDRIVLRALSKKREDRWWSAEEMAKALAAVMAPASKADVVNLLDAVGRDEIEQRARHVRDLRMRQGRQGAGGRPIALAPEAQIVLDVLTRRRQQRDAVGTTRRDDRTSVETPLKKHLAAPAMAPSDGANVDPQRRNAHPAAKQTKEDARRKRKRIRTIPVLLALGATIVFLMVVALVLGMRLGP